MVQEPSWSDLTVDNNGVQLAVRDYGGEGTPLLLLHGMTQNLECWDSLLPALADRYRVAAMDLRCHGRSGDGPFTWESAVGDVEAVVVALGIERPAVVGHSLGGMVAAAYAATRDDCLAAVNLDGSGNGRPEFWPEAERDVTLERAALLRRMAAAMWPSAPLPREVVDQIGQARTAAAVNAGMDPEAAARLWERSLQPQPDGTVLIRPSGAHTEAMTDLIEAENLVALQSSTLHPLLVVQGTNVPGIEEMPVEQRDALPPWLHEHLVMINRTTGEALAAAASDHPLLEYRPVDLTHALILEDPAGVAGIVGEFLDRAAASEPSRS